MRICRIGDMKMESWCIVCILQEFERKIYQKIKYNGVEHTYDFIMKNEVQKLKKFIEQRETYKPYKYT